MTLVQDRRKEKRIWYDTTSGMYHLQIHYVPVYSWEDDGWKTIYASDSQKQVVDRYFGKEYK